MKIIKTNAEARRLLKNGVDAVANVVKATLGPHGRNVVLGRRYTQPVITNDGVSIARDIELEDEIENTGAQIIKEASVKTNDRVGDGTTTSTVIAQAIINEGFNRLEDTESLVKSRVNPVWVKREIDHACKMVIDALKKKAKPIKTEAEIAAVATVSAESEEYGQMLAEIITKIGKDGVITVKESEGLGVKYEVATGLEVAYGYTSPYMSTNDRQESVTSDISVLVTNQTIETAAQLAPLAEKLADQGKRELFVASGGVSDQALATIVVNRVKDLFKITLIKVTGSLKDEVLTDIAAVTGATLIDSKSNMKVAEAELKDLGHCEQIISTTDKTIFAGGKGNPEKRVAELKAQLEKIETQFDKEMLEERIAKLTGGVAVVQVGAPTETERTYLKLKLDDAVCAVKAAIAEGVVPGAGIALKELAEELEPNILTEALKAPYNQIRENAGGEIDVPKTIVDPVKVTRIALENACSVAGTLLTTEAVVVPKREKEENHGRED